MRVLLLLLTAPLLAHAQVYRCGNTWSQTPCEPGAKPVVAALPRAKLATPEQMAVDLPVCHSRIRERLVDPDSAKMAAPAVNLDKGTERYYLISVNARNRMGGMAGPHTWSCQVAERGGGVVVQP